MATFAEEMFKHIHAAESPVAHMYLDIYGHPTIGYGHLLLNRDKVAPSNWQRTLKKSITALQPYNVVRIESNAEDIWDHGSYSPSCRQRPPGPISFLSEPASEVPAFFSQLAPGPWGTDRPFDDDGIDMMVKEAEEMMRLPFGNKFGASHFRQFTSFEIASRADMVRLAYDDIDLKVAEVKRQANFADFDSFPRSGQLAVVDLAYQGGAEMIANKYKHGEFGKAVKERRWHDAARLCPGPAEKWPPAERQQVRRTWLIEALKNDPKSDVGNLYQYNNEARAVDLTEPIA